MPGSLLLPSTDNLAQISNSRDSLRREISARVGAAETSLAS